MKYRTMALLLAMLFVLGGCSSAPQEPAAEKEGLQVVATIFAPYDFARTLVQGTQTQVKMLIKPGVESHTFDPSPSDVIAIHQADVFVCIGGHDEAWVDAILESQEEGPGQVVKLIDHVHGEEDHHHHDHDGHDHAHEQDSHGLDEHIWTSPKNALIMAQAIAQALEQADPANSRIYQENMAAYAKELNDLDQQFAEIVRQGARKEFVFADRFPFIHFANAYALTGYSAFDSCSGESEPSAADVAHLIDLVREKEIPVIYHIEQGNMRTVQAIAQETGAQVELFHSCHNLTVQELEGGETYLSLMKKNALALEKGLEGE